MQFSVCQVLIQYLASTLIFLAAVIIYKPFTSCSSSVVSQDGRVRFSILSI